MIKKKAFHIFFKMSRASDNTLKARNKKKTKIRDQVLRCEFLHQLIFVDQLLF